jgi:hypothetical protein
VNQLVLVNQPELDDLLADRGRTVKNHSSLFQALERSLGQSAEPPWPGFNIGFQQGPERVEIVAVHAGTPRWAGKDEMGVTMIDHVCEIVSRCRSTSRAPESDPSVEEAVCIEPGPAKDGKSTEDTKEFRSDILGDDRVRKLIEQLIGTEIHARPLLGPKVANDRKAEPYRSH